MVELYVDIITNKITGYNAIIPKDTTDCILVDEKELRKMAGFPSESYYYIEGETISMPDPEGAYFSELGNLDAQYERLHQNVMDEQKLFMDKVLAGVAIEEAAREARENRERMALVAEQRKKLEEGHQKAVMEAAIKKFEEEEAGIKYRHFLSMVTVVRDENDYLEEWIRYHIEEMGFEHFYIYDNESSVPVLGYLESVGFVHMDKVTVIPWPTSRNTQQDSHNDFLKRFGKETKWFLAADPDEYVVINDGKGDLKEFLGRNTQYAVIGCIWHHFNANGQEKKTEGTDMERFTEEVDWDYGKGRGKRFAQSNRIRSMANYVPQPRAYAEENDNKKKEFFHLNHYYTRSYEEWLQKMARGTAVPYAKRKHSDFFELNPEMAYLETGGDYEQGYGHAGSQG